MKLDIVTPSRRLTSSDDESVRLPCDTESVLLPGIDGEYEILPGHVPLLTLLGTGLLRFTCDGKTTEMMVSGGFAEVDSDNVTVMTQVASLGEEIDKAGEQKSLETFSKELGELGPVAEDDAEFRRLRAETERAAARLELLN